MKKQVLVAGGGIGGLSAALGASRAGWDVRLYERSQVFSEAGAGVQLGPNGVQCLHAWGLQRHLLAVAAFPLQLQVRSARNGRELAVLPLGSSITQRYGVPYATVHRGDLHGLLLNAVAQYTSTQLNLGHTIDHFTQDHGVVAVRTSHGKEIEGDALIGADGLWSSTRAQLLGGAQPRATGHLAYRALVRQEALPIALRTQQITVWLGPRMHAVQYPVRRGELQNWVVIVQGSAPQDLQNWDHAAHMAELDAALAGTCTPLQHAIYSTTAAGAAWRLWPLCDRFPMRGPQEMAQGLVALLGDAAHPMRPYLAQGAGMAIEDAVQLQHVLAMNTLDIPLRLRRYALNRWQRNARVQARSLRNGRIFHAAGPVRWARDLALRMRGERILDMPWLYAGGNNERSQF